ncbi:MAG: protein translocase subunit SecD, partial [Rhodospirillales bacterium]|nr:protein translocase subunit SecD [Rhodospirillales bacterium]
MMFFSRWKTAGILLVCLIGVLTSLPNLVPRAAFPGWFPVRQVNLGLDLRGGSYLLLEVDTTALLRDR